MGNCPSQCGSLTILGNPQAACATSIRKKTVSRILFFACSTTLPTVFPGNIAPLFASGEIVASMPLANIVWADPVTEDIIIDECSPAQPVITTRQLTFEDRNAVSSTTGSPATTNEFFDYDFWQDKNNTQTYLAYMIAYCDGDVVVPLDENGNYLKASLLVYLQWQKPSNQGGSWIEYKKGTITFQGDPMSMNLPPSFNLETEGIVL